MTFNDLIIFVYNACVDFIEFSDIVFEVLNYEVSWLGDFSIWNIMFGPGFLIFVTVLIVQRVV